MTGLAGSFLSSNAAQNAAQTQANAAQYSANIQRQEFEQIRRSLEPWVRSGKLANADLLRKLMSGQLTRAPQATIGSPLEDLAGSKIDKQFQTSPSYNFELAQGTQAIQDAGTGTTGAIGGNTLKSLQSYGTGLAGQDFWNWYNAQNNQYWNRYNAITNRQNQIYNMYAGLSGQGLGAATTTGQFGQTAVSNIGSDIMSGAAASAAGTVGSANAISGGLNSLGSNLYSMALLQQLYGGGYSGATGGANPTSYGTGGYY